MRVPHPNLVLALVAWSLWSCGGEEEDGRATGDASGAAGDTGSASGGSGAGGGGTAASGSSGGGGGAPSDGFGVIASGRGLVRLRLEGDSVYFLSAAAGTIERVGKDGSAQTTLVTGLVEPNDFVLTSDGFVWTEQGVSNDQAVGTVGTAKRDGSDKSALYAGRRAPRWIVESSGDVFWTEYGATTLITTTIVRGGLDGAAAEVVASGQPFSTGLAVDATRVFWITDSAPTSSDGTGDLLAAKRTAVEGGVDAGVEVLVPSQPNPSGLPSDGASLYFIRSASDPGGVFDLTSADVTYVGDSIYKPWLIAGDTTMVFIAEYNGDVFACPHGGDACSNVAHGGGPLRDLAVDESSIYWIDSGGAVVRAPR